MKHACLLLSLTLVFLWTAQSCQKDNETPSVSAILIDGTWQITAIAADPPFEVTPGDTLSDLLLFQPDCVLDNTLQFLEDGSLTVDENALKCDPMDPQTITSGTWSLSSDEKVLTIIEFGTPRMYTIESFTSIQMILTIPANQTHPDYPATSIVRFTFTKV